MIAVLVTWLAKLGAGGIVDRAIELVEMRAGALNDRETIQADLTAEYLRQVIAETQEMAELSKAKFAVPWFWLFAGLFLAPLAIWWAAVCFYNMLWCPDCIYAQPWTIAAFPAPLDDWAGNMIQWIFYVGSGVAGLRAILKK
ncbi:MAG: hypothetical protein CMH13_08750 [Martelella sp.]|uniref:hypothetical protein n=1 Tax=unclassified Martelella TaxID=2629616 RepID=UPI000C557B6C|nr:hypothetical protein [Martelella sp.]MAU20607.1 hypothetical protein [Martelella sp.]|tara:strand:- start:267 stop:692 length:426 start_codon:yes stop_codon:yes gene_type:complete